MNITTDPRSRARATKRRASCADGACCAPHSTRSNESTNAAVTVAQDLLGVWITATRCSCTPSSAAAAQPICSTPTQAAQEPACVGPAATANATAVAPTAPLTCTMEPRCNPPPGNTSWKACNSGSLRCSARTTGRVCARAVRNRAIAAGLFFESTARITQVSNTCSILTNDYSSSTYPKSACVGTATPSP